MTADEITRLYQTHLERIQQAGYMPGRARTLAMKATERHCQPNEWRNWKYQRAETEAA